MDKLSYRRHRFPSIVIQQAVWLYFRFALSYRDVEDMLPTTMCRGHIDL
jgi:putative transposase